MQLARVRPSDEVLLGCDRCWWTVSCEYSVLRHRDLGPVLLVEPTADYGRLLDLLPPEGHPEQGLTYGRLWSDRPATAIPANYSRPSGNRSIHPTQPRLITPREAMRSRPSQTRTVYPG